MTARSPIRYAHNGDAAIAYMESGSGIDLLVIGGFVSHLEIVPSLPAAQRFWDRMGSFARVILFDKRGMGLSDRDAGAYTLENVVDDALAVLDALDVPKSAIFGISEGGSAATMLAAAHPDRVSAMVQYGTYARLAQATITPRASPTTVSRSEYRRLNSSLDTRPTYGPNPLERRSCPKGHRCRAKSRLRRRALCAVARRARVNK
jgi:pimeloyl-ACP methyl ester carboxylesterase